MKNRTFKIFGLVIRLCFYKENSNMVKVFRRPYPWDKPTKEFEAIVFRFMKVGFWVFRSEKIYQDWPRSN